MATTKREKPCADCGQKKMGGAAKGATAASSYDALLGLGASPETAALVVELGIHATEDSDPLSVLSLALAAAAEREGACTEALKEAEVEVEKLQEALDDLENSYNTLVESVEGTYSPLDTGRAVPDTEES